MSFGTKLSFEKTLETFEMKCFYTWCAIINDTSPNVKELHIQTWDYSYL